jgi:K+-sensing histidine kinase KdpD
MADLFTLSRSCLEEFPLRRLAVMAMCVMLTLIVGFVDFATGYEMDFLLFYFIPIGISAWFVGSRPAFFIVMLSVATWLLADIMSSHQPSSWLIEWWNAIIQGLIFSLVALTMSFIRSAFDEKQELNSTLSEALRKLEDESRERLQAEQGIIQQNEFLRHVFESVTHPFYVVDAEDYTVVMANTAAIPEGLPNGTKCFALTHHQAEPCGGLDHVCPLQTVKGTKKPFTTEHIHYGEGESAQYVEVHSYPVLDKDGNVSQIIEYTLDISDRKKLEAILRSNAEKIKLFAYSVSHDLKSPLIGINGLTNLLHKQYRDILDEKGRKYCDQILKASENALRLVEEINVFIKTKETPLTFERISPKELLQTIRNEFDPLFNTRRIEWSEPARIPGVTADRLSLLRVFRNLVDNALKYGGEQLSEIAIGYEGTGEYHTFSVADDGAGIAGEDCEKIFELFQRNSASRTSKEPAWG